MINLKRKPIIACLFCIVLFVTIVFTNCVTRQKHDFSQYNLSLKNTLSIFLLNNGNNYFFCIFLQYIGDFEISNFEFDHGNILIGDYNISLNRSNVNVLMFLSEPAPNEWPDYYMNQYTFFIERHLTNNEMKNIINQYRMGNIHSSFYIWFDITIDGEEQPGSGILDTFELFNGPIDKDILNLFPHFEIFIEKYL